MTDAKNASGVLSVKLASTEYLDTLNDIIDLDKRLSKKSLLNIDLHQTSELFRFAIAHLFLCPPKDVDFFCHRPKNGFVHLGLISMTLFFYLFKTG